MYNELLKALKEYCKGRGYTLDESAQADLQIPAQGGKMLILPMIFISLNAEQEQKGQR